MIDKEIHFDFSEIEKTAKEFLKATTDYKVFAFSGDLGAGKTSFITALCKVLGVSDNISSPTYSIIHEYKTNDNKTIYHMDLYRIKTKEEAIDAGVEDCLLSNQMCFVEWPDKAPGIFPDNTIYSEIEILSETKRKLITKLPA